MVKGRGIALVMLIALGLVACAQIIGLSKLQEGGDPSEDAGDGAIVGDGGDGAVDADAEPLDHCSNGVKDDDETDVDCGGKTCGKCAKGKACLVDSDCAKQCAGNKCVGCAGVELAGPDGPCIDATEVTVGEYFAGFGPGRRTIARDSGAPSFCPADVVHPAQSDAKHLPLRGVRWCTAWAYCRFRGKHLCESSRGRSEWFVACSNDGGLAYPYGNSFEPARCNDDGAGGPWEAGSGTNCKTLDPLNVYDLSGNVAEWENACDAGGRGSCIARGGSYLSDSNGVRCDAAELIAVDVERPDVGFRCCE